MGRSFLVGILFASRVWKMILLLFVANLLFSLPVVVPIFLLITQTAGGTTTANKMLADKIDLNWIMDLFNQQLPGASLEATGFQVIVLLVVMGLSYLLLNTFLAGGIIGTFASQGGYFTMRAFWRDCGTYFWRFFRLIWFSILFYLAALIIGYLMRWWLVDRIDQQATAYGQVVYRSRGLVLAMLLLFSFINMVFDYARISTVVNDRRRMFRETMRAWRFSLRHFFGAFSLYLLIAAIGITLFFSLTRMRNSIHQVSLLAVLAVMVISQLAIIIRIWTRLTFYAAELNYYRRHYLPLARPLAPVADDGTEFLDAMDEGQVVSVSTTSARNWPDNRSVDQSIDQSVDQSVDQFADQSVSESEGQAADQVEFEPEDQSADQTGLQPEDQSADHSEVQSEKDPAEVPSGKVEEERTPNR